MSRWTREDLGEMADHEEGFCLACGDGPQEILETRCYLGLCQACWERRVLPAEVALLVLDRVMGEEE